MRVLSIGNFSEPSWDGSIPDEEHIAKALEWQGHEVVRIQREELSGSYTPEWDHVDFVLVAQWDGFTGSIKNISSAPLVYWAFDYQAEGQEWHERLVAEADLYLSKRIADSKYPNWHWFSQDFAPMFLNRYDEKPERDIDVLFTGSYLPWATERNETLKAIDEKFNLVIHSVNEWPGYKDVRPPVMDTGLPALYARAKIVISIDHTIEAGYWSDRNAQIMACGTFVLFRYVPFSEHTFQDKVAYFYNIDDCLGQIRHYLDHEGQRKIKGLRGYNFAQNNLLVKHRVRDLITLIKDIL